MTKRWRTVAEIQEDATITPQEKDEETNERILEIKRRYPHGQQKEDFDFMLDLFSAAAASVRLIGERAQEVAKVNITLQKQNEKLLEQVQPTRLFGADGKPLMITKRGP